MRRWFARRPEELRTERLVLIASTTEMMEADRSTDYATLGILLRARITAEWPPVHWEPHIFDFITKQLTEQPETAGWHRYVLLPEGRARVLVGCIGAFPRPGGEAELGYSTLPEFQRRGLAVEAVRALMRQLFAAGVQTVSAQTYPSLPESIKVMQRCGMTPAGEGDEPGTVRYQVVGPKRH